MTGLQAFSNNLSELVARSAAAVVGVEHRRGQGSGLVIAQDGYVLTNAHVAQGSGPLRVRISGSRVASGELVGADERTDLAVLRIGLSNLPVLTLSERQLRVGEVVVAIGNPLGFERSVTVGVVSALYRNLPAQNTLLEGLIQTDASINPGNSGGPLLDAQGQVVGLSTAIIPWARGIGFAVPARTASWVASVLIRDGQVRRPFLGIAARGEDLDPVLFREAGLDPRDPRAGGGGGLARPGRRAAEGRPAAGRQRDPRADAGRPAAGDGPGAAVRDPARIHRAAGRQTLSIRPRPAQAAA